MSYIWSIHIDWNNTGSFSTDINEAIYCNALEINRGFDSIFDVKSEGYHEAFSAPKVGNARMTLDNKSGRFDPWDASSDALGFNIAPNKQVQILVRESTGSSDTTLFTGLTKSIEHDRKSQSVSISCVDGVEWLQEHDAYVPFYAPTIAGSLSSDIPLLDDVVDDVVTSSSYPFGKTTWATAGLPYYSHSGKANTALIELAAASGALFYINKNGQVATFGMTGATTDGVTEYDASVFMKDVYISLPYEHIKTTYRDYLVSTTQGSTDSILWEQGYDKEFIEAGQTSEKFIPFRFDNENVMGVSNTPVSSSDYVANTEQDGSGTDRTANVSFSVFDFGKRAKKTVKNNSSDDIYMTTQMIRGTPYVEKEVYTEFNNTDYLGAGKKIIESKRRVLWKTSITNLLITPFQANAQFSRLGYPQSNKKIRLKIDTQPEQFDLDIGDRFMTNIANPDLAPHTWNGTSVYNMFKLTGVSHSWQRENGQSVLTTWTGHHIFETLSPIALTEYLIDEDGNYLIDESGNLLLAQIG